MTNSMDVFYSFVNNKKAYAMNHNGVDGFCLPPEDRGNGGIVIPAERAYPIDDTYTISVGDDRSKNAITFHSAKYESMLTLREISLDDAAKAFPHSPRTYASPADLEEKIAMTIAGQNSYQPSVISLDPTYSFTFDGDEALELIKVDDDGNMYLRDGGDWTEVTNNKNYPTIFDRDLIDIEPDDVDKAVAFWDANSGSEKGVTKEQMLPFAALVQ